MNRLSDHINNLANGIGISKSEICDLAGVPASMKKRVSQDFSKMPLVNVLQLTDHLYFDFDRLVTGEVNLVALKEHYQGNLTYFPKRYQTYKKSKMSTIHNFLGYSLENLDVHQVDKILKRLQIPKPALENVNQETNVLLLMDLFREFSFVSRNRDAYFEIGKRLCNSHMSKALSKVGNSSKEPKKIFESFIENIHSEVEFNMEYRILACSERKMVIMAQTREETQDNFQRPTFANEHHYENILGYYSQIAENIFKAKPKVTRLTSWQQVSAELIFEIEFPSPKKSL